MCSQLLERKPCLNHKCPHNLFWEGLKLNKQRIHITEKAIRIRNCCRLIREPWTLEEIAEAWGLRRRTVVQSEETAWRKLKKKSYGKEQREAIAYL
jgi:DNA-directed RNA polymerase sigma subunit (sigma70/sigma32)